MIRNLHVKENNAFIRALNITVPNIDYNLSFIVPPGIHTF